MIMSNWGQQLRYSPYKSELISAKDLAIRYSFEADITGNPSLKLESVWESKQTRSILNKQRVDGSWKYSSKKSEAFSKMDYDLYETIVVLASLVEVYRLDKSHPAIKRVAEYLFNNQSNRGDIRRVYANQYSPNYSAMVAELLIKAGHQDNPRVIKILDWLMANRQQDGGWALPFRTQGYNLQSFGLDKTIEADYSKPSSAMVTGVVLRAMAIHPKFKSRNEVKQAAQALADNLFMADKYPDRKSKEYWTRFSYPFVYTDLVSALDSLSLIGGFENHPNVRKALAWLKEQQTKDGLFDLRTTGATKTLKKCGCQLLCIEFSKDSIPQNKNRDICLCNLGSGGGIRTRDQLINSQLRYRCATPEYTVSF